MQFSVLKFCPRHSNVENHRCLFLDDNAAREKRGDQNSAWTAFSQCSVADFLSQPNALNDPLGKAVEGALEAIAKDPNLINKTMSVLGRQIQEANERYNSMSCAEKGRFIGQAMFYMFNSESGAGARSANLASAEQATLAKGQLVKDLGDASSMSRA